GAQDLCLLGLELGVGEDALGLQVGQPLKLTDDIGLGCSRGGRSRGGRRLLVVLLLLLLLLVVLLVFLLGPTIGLPAGDAVGNRGRGAGNHGRAGNASHESRHGSSFLAFWEGISSRWRRVTPPECRGGCNPPPRAGHCPGAGLARRVWPTG